jgi:hypothetical protein
LKQTSTIYYQVKLKIKGAKIAPFIKYLSDYQVIFVGSPKAFLKPIV